MTEIFALYDPVDEEFRLTSREAAIGAARSLHQSVDGGEGWPEGILRLGIYRHVVTPEQFEERDIEGDDWRPVWTLREKPGSRQSPVTCAHCKGQGSAGPDGEDGCAECDGYGEVCDGSGEPWEWSDEFLYLVEYEFPPEPIDLSVEEARSNG